VKYLNNTAQRYTLNFTNIGIYFMTYFYAAISAIVSGVL